MMPVLLSIGPFVLYSGSTLLLVGWIVASFVFWKNLREEAVPEEKIFDCMFYMTVVGLVTARLGYVLLHWPDFSGNILKIAALWVAPGLWFYAGLLGMFVTILYLSRRLKIRLSFVVDALGLSLASSGVVASLGTLLEGSEVGKVTTLPWKALYVGHGGLRHPYGLYAAILFALLCFVLYGVQKIAIKRHLPYGIIGITYFVLSSLFFFFLEFLKESTVYFKGLSVNQWVLIAIFAQSVGALWVRLKVWFIVKPFIGRFFRPFKKTI